MPWDDARGVVVVLAAVSWLSLAGEGSWAGSRGAVAAAVAAAASS